ncbi:MAG: hypothetical protein GKS06_16980 [Acidobacteria bacterium]|nr:hypothetical protein [Acidobacteriota bacterium]
MSPDSKPRRGVAAYVHGIKSDVELERLVDTCDVVVDAMGTFCPEPVIRTQNAARELSAGTVVMILADDAGVEIDLPAWCISTRNEYLGVLREPDKLRVFVRKAAPKAR